MGLCRILPWSQKQEGIQYSDQIPCLKQFVQAMIFRPGEMVVSLLSSINGTILTFIRNTQQDFNFIA